MAKVMLTVRLPGKTPSLKKVQRKLKLKDEEIDRDFGVVSIDPDNELYAVMVEETVGGEAAEQEEDVSGPFSDPAIEAFGPLQHSDKR
jgi:hypothetical protein